MGKGRKLQLAMSNVQFDFHIQKHYKIHTIDINIKKKKKKNKHMNNQPKDKRYGGVHQRAKKARI